MNSRFSRMFGRRIRMLVAVAVVFSTTYSLILPAITIDANTAAVEPGMEVFREPADYTLACRFIPHAHTEDCYIEKDIIDAEGNPTGQRERVLICGKETMPFMFTTKTVMMKTAFWSVRFRRFIRMSMMIPAGKLKNVLTVPFLNMCIQRIVMQISK